MKKQFALFLMLLYFQLNAQEDFPYKVMLNPIEIPSLSGMHSYAAAQLGSKWLIFGGRKDGIHARQPFNAFPKNQNNDSIFVIDIDLKKVWSRSLNELPSSIKEQLQSTNINFHQSSDTLLLLGGYAFSETANDHITFPNLTIVSVSNLIKHLIENESIEKDFIQITDQRFANTGGHLNKIDQVYYLVGGHRFDGRYNPMNNPTFVQTYLDGILKFKINTGKNITFIDTIIDQVHLHRRDFNLLTQFDKGEKSLLLSSGVFQPYEDLPFLYPIEIKKDSYKPITSFNQYLSNYHSATTSFYDQSKNTNFTLFYGGISRYFFKGLDLVSDSTVPFVKTISLLKNREGSLKEYQLETQMPSLKGAGAHFFVNQTTKLMDDEVIDLSSLNIDTNRIGYIFGGISSQSSSAFDDNETDLTKADPSVYEVILVKSNETKVLAVEKNHNLNFSLEPVSSKGILIINYELDHESELYFFITNEQGKIVDEGYLSKNKKGMNSDKLKLFKSMENGIYNLTIEKNSTDFATSSFILSR